MLKHVQLSPHRTRACDTLSLSSTSSYSSLSPEPLSSRASSCSSLNDSEPTTIIKVYARCLRPDIEYKSLSITYQTTCRDIIKILLNKYKMRHRDPNLFFLTMEVSLRKVGYKHVLVLNDEARPAALEACHPRGESKFALQTRRGGLVKIYDSAIMPGSQYKSLLIAEITSVDDVIQILLSCYGSKDQVEQFSLYEVCKNQEYQRKLHPDDKPLMVQMCWNPSQDFHFLIRRNLDFRPRSPKIVWASDLAALPCSSRQSISVEDGDNILSDYDNYFYI